MVMTMKYGYRFSAICLTFIGTAFPHTARGQANSGPAPQTPPVSGHRAEGYDGFNKPLDNSPERVELRRRSNEIRARERELHAEALKLAAAGKREDALKLLREESTLDDSDPLSAHTNLMPRIATADIFFAQGHYADAAAIYDSILTPEKGGNGGFC